MKNESNFLQFSAYRVFPPPSVMRMLGLFLSGCHLALLPPEVPQLDAPPAGHAAERGRLDAPVFHRVGEQADGRVRFLLLAGRSGAEVVVSHIVDFVAVKKNDLCRRRD